MKYELGLMDFYPIEGSGSDIENDPLFKITLKHEIDPVRLEDAVYRAIRFHPLFGTQIGFDKSYYLSTNSRPVRLIHAREEQRPLKFGKQTNGYPWQLCWFDREMTFEWCHGITDGTGALNFIKSVLSFYCEIKVPVVPRKIELGPGLEPFYDRSEKGINYEIQPQGFPSSAFPVYKRGYQSDCWQISARTEDVIRAAKQSGSTPSALLAVLISRALRSCLPENAPNRNVATNIAINLRKLFDYETMHNCVDFKRVTYMDRHDGMELFEAAKEFRDSLSQVMIHENAVRMVSDRVSVFKAFHLIPGKKLRKLGMKLIGKYLSDRDCNVQITYLGAFNAPSEVREEVENVRLRCWTDFGYCTLGMIDYEGSFNIELCQNYRDTRYVDKFIELCAAAGIGLTVEKSFLYEQARFIEEGESDRADPELPGEETVLPGAQSGKQLEISSHFI